MKTLKDFEPILWCNGEIETELKKEAINWYIKLRDGRNPLHFASMAWIEMFFNLTKEDIEEYDKANK